ncbi:fatty acid desaturase [bacterium]|nr:fatty acid desaturase [bacterium]
MCPPSDIARSPLTRAAAKVANGDAKEDAHASVNDSNHSTSTLEPHLLARTFKTRWVRVGDFEYDVTNFKHPGGSVIFYMLANTGADATEAFTEFHMRSPKAWKMLKALPNRPAPTKRTSDPDHAMLTDFAKWRLELENEGYFKPSKLHLTYRLTELVAMFALGTYFMTLKHPILAAAVYGCFFGARCGWVQHEGGHNSLTGKIWWDKRIQAATCGFGLSTSSDMWNQMHNKHHATPQKVRHDMDLDTTPAVAFFKTAVEDNRPRGFSRMWARVQAWTFVPITSGILVQGFWIYVLHPRQVFRRNNYEEGMWMLMSHVVRTAVIKYALQDATWPVAYLYFTLSNWFAYMYLFAHFSTSHTHTEVLPSDKHISWVHYAVDHTVDISTDSPVVNWLMGYLNCQVIHHLFPDMPQFRQPGASEKFKAFAKKWDLNYKMLTYYGAWKATFGNLDEVGQHYYMNGTSSKAH